MDQVTLTRREQLRKEAEAYYADEQNQVLEKTLAEESFTVTATENI